MRQNFLLIIEQDTEGNDSAMVYLNKDQIVSAIYSPVKNEMLVVTTAMSTKTGKVYEPLLNKNKQPTGGYAEGVVSQGESVSYPIGNPENIVKIHNYLTNNQHTVENFPGFELHRIMSDKIADAKARKQEEERLAGLEKRMKELEKEWEKENARRERKGEAPISIEEFKKLNNITDGKEGETTQPQSGGLTSIPGGKGGAEGEQALTDTGAGEDREDSEGIEASEEESKEEVK